MNWKIEKEKINIMLAIFITGLILLFSSNTQILLHIISIWMLVIVATITVKMDIFHPYCWFSFFFGLYSTSYSILLYLGRTTTIYGYNKASLVYQWLALVVALLVLPAYRINIVDVKSNLREKEYGVMQLLLKCILVSLIISVAYFVQSGFAGKNEIYENINIVFKLVFSLAYLGILTYSFLLNHFLAKNSKGRYGLYIATILTIALFGFTIGERDYGFRIFLITALVLFIHGKISRKLIICLIPIGFILLPLTHMFKYTLLTGEISADLDLEQFFIWLLEGEFISAGRNLQILVQNNMYNYFGGYSLFIDFIRIFYDVGFSNQLWFDERFFDYGHMTQYGFTLVGEGYVNGGTIGIIIIYSIVSVLLRILYMNVKKSPYWLIIYLYMLPLFIYTTRADISNLFSPLIKHVALGILFIKFVSRLKVKME